jgi:hypothetical protein
MIKRLFTLAIAVFLAASFSVAQDLDGLMKLKPGRSRAVTSTDPSFTGNADRIKYITPGETKVLADMKGPGVVRHIWLTFSEARPNWLEAGGSAAPDEIVIRMYWDGAKEPAVEAPLGDFFGAGFGRRYELVSVPVQVEAGGDGYNCFWPMPFFKRGLITVTNEGAKNVRSFYYHIDYTEDPGLPRDTAYFCAQYNQAFPEKPGRDYLIADIKGKGHYVGTVMSIRARSPFWFGEGDARFYIDGESKPSIQGTGTEDYFLMAWGMSLGLYPYFGCVRWSPEGEVTGTEYSMYRWHIADPVRFSQSLRFEIEHTGWMAADETESGKVEGHVEREDDIATVAFWYRAPAVHDPPSARRTPFPEPGRHYRGKNAAGRFPEDQGRRRTPERLRLDGGWAGLFPADRRPARSRGHIRCGQGGVPGPRPADDPRGGLRQVPDPPRRKARAAYRGWRSPGREPGLRFLFPGSRGQGRHPGQPEARGRETHPAVRGRRAEPAVEGRFSRPGFG